MERMEHVRGKLLSGDRVLLEGVEAHLGSHARPGGHRSWFGYFEFAAGCLAGVAPGGPYRLALEDGRSGDLYLDIQPSNRPGHALVEFSLGGMTGGPRVRGLGARSLAY